MKEIEYDGNIYLLPNGDALSRDAGVVTTNGMMCKDGKAVMDAGISKYCRNTFDGVDKLLGDLLERNGNHVHCLGWRPIPRTTPGLFLLISFPTKDDWKEDSKQEIMKLADEDKIDNIYMPCPGCGNGGLDYWEDVRPVLLEMLDDRFIVCIPKHIMEAHKT